MLKKIQVLFLTLAMLVTLLPISPVFADTEQESIIYENDFESDESAVSIGENRVLEFTVAGDVYNSWVSIFQQDLVFEYTDEIHSGATLSFDLLLPPESTYTGLFKAQAVTKMGTNWTWTQSDTIQEIGIDDFDESENGYLEAHVSIAFGDEIEAIQGLKSIVPCLAASNCDYSGQVYLDNVKFVDGEEDDDSELPEVESLVFSFDSEEDINQWSDGGSYDYSGGLTIGYDNTICDGAMKLDVDYTDNASSSWSEAKVNYSFEEEKQLEGYNQFSLDFIYDPANMTTGSFSTKLFAGVIDTNTSVKDEEDYGDGLKKATVVLTFTSAGNLVTGFTIGLVGVQTDYKGSIYIDNVTFSQITEYDIYVDATKTIEEQVSISTNSDSILANGQTQETSSSIKSVDDNVEDYTAQLYAYLEAVGKTDSVLFGHQNDITHKSGSASLTNSDTKDITGSISAVMGIDTLSLTGNELAAAAWNLPLADRVAACEEVTKEVAEQGAIITLSAHMPNFEIIDQRVQNSLEGTADSTDSNSVGILSDGSYNFSGYTPGTLTGDIVTRIMPGQDLNYLYTAYLDMIAAYGKALEDDEISVLFRPFHECTGSWFWWGKAFCDSEAYKNLFKYTIEYLRDVKDVHNFIYVYGPGSEAESTDDYAERYPGDDYVDMVGFDMYHSYPTEGDNFINQFKTELSIVQQFAEEHNKLFAITETGVSNGTEALLKTGNERKDWHNEILDAVAPSSACYFLLWANFGENISFYTPYVVSKTDKTMRGHEMLDNFIDFYNDPRSVFANEMGDFTQISAAVAPNTNVTGYITSPVSGSRILSAVTIEASVSNEEDTSVVEFVVKNKEGAIVHEIPAAKNDNGRYTGILTNDILASLGQTAGTISLIVDGEIYNIINIMFNMPEPVVDPTVVDTFENYYGDNDIMNISWSTGNGSGCTIVHSLSDKSYEGNYGLEFKYSLIAGGYAGITKSMDGADWSSKNALQLWTIPDNKKQKVVIQVTSGSNVFEVYLNQFDEYNNSNDPLLVTIPFSSFVGRDDAEAVFDAATIESFGLWCNAIVPDGEDWDTYELDSVLYYDDIKAITSDVEDITFVPIETNESPTLNEIANKTINEGELLEFTVSGDDPDGDSFILSASDLPDDATFDESSGIFSWTPDFDQSGEYIITFSVSDGNLSDSQEVEITVDDVMAVQYTQDMIDTIKEMNLNKVTSKLLIKQLNAASKLLNKNKPILALTAVKVFMLHVNIAKDRTISLENANLLLEDSVQLCRIIINDFFDIETKEKYNALKDLLDKYKLQDENITSDIFDSLYNSLKKIIDSIK